MELYDKDGNAVDVPVEKLEDITALQEKAKRVDELEPLVKPDIRNMRKIIDEQGGRIKDQDGRIKDMVEKLKVHGENPDQPEQITSEKMAEIARSEFSKTEAEKVERRRQTMLDSMSGGDEQKKKVLDEKWSMVSGGRQIADHDEMVRLMDDAAYLSKKTMDKAHIPFSNAGGSSPSGTPQRGDVSGDRATAVSNLESAGYKFKTDKSKLINK